MPISTIGSLNGNYIDQLYADAVFVARAENVMHGLVTVYGDQAGDQPRTLPEYPRVAAQEVAETDDFTADTELTKTALATLTPLEAMAQVVLTDRRIETDASNARSDASIELGEAIADKMESDLIAAFADLTGPEIGDGTAAITWGAVFAARARLAGAKVNGPYALVLHPYQWHPLAEAASVAGAQTNASAGLLDEVNRAYFVASVAGVDVFVSANVPIASDAAVAAMFARDAIALDIRRAPRLEPERDASARTWELNMSVKYAAGAWRKAHGLQLNYTAALPDA